MIPALAAWMIFRWIVSEEERMLRASFGAPFENYCARVPRFPSSRPSKPLSTPVGCTSGCGCIEVRSGLAGVLAGEGRVIHSKAV